MARKKQKKTKPRVLIFSGYGLNCEEETKYAFELAGGRADIVHINDLIDGRKRMKDYQILVFPGGFSYGDDTGSGKAYANRVRNHLSKDLEEFISANKLVIGICNGFQILTSLGLLPGALTFNEKARYIDRWVDLEVEAGNLWFKNIKSISLPIAHGEGKFYADKKTLKELNENRNIAVRYVKGEICRYQNLPVNPNGSLENIAAVMSHDGRVLGMMPHPERGIFTSQLPQFGYLKEKTKREGKRLPKYTLALQIFKNAIEFFHG